MQNPTCVQGEAAFSAGESAFPVPMRLHKENRDRLCARLAKTTKQQDWIVLAGGQAETRYDTDHEPLFRQEAYFQHVFGVKEPDCMGAIHVASREAILFIPRLPAHYATWMGEIKTPEWFRSHYDVNACFFVDEIATVLKGKAVDTLLLLKGLNTDSGAMAKPASFDGIDAFKTDEETLFAPFVEIRMIKTPLEIAVMRHVCQVSSDAHEQVMRRVRAGMDEYQVEALFRYYCHDVGGFRHTAYTCICASGAHGAVLHYGHAGAPNDRRLTNDDMLLFDMGGEYHRFCADITRSYPVTGKFSDRQRAIYSIVLAAQQAVFDAIKPGVSYVDMHKLAERTTLHGLVKIGVLKGDVDEMLEKRLGAVFMPHGLGHMLGLETHDVGGYHGGEERSTLPGLKSLRLTCKMQAGMVITVEPGCYFIDHLLDEVLADEELSGYVVESTLATYRGFGGVRIEDDIVITETGMENLTTVCRQIDEIEALMAQRLPLPFASCHKASS